MTIWSDYYAHFDGLEPGAVRAGCEPRVLEHSEPPPRGIVLVHGLTDSPHFMRAIAERFHARGWDAYLPLLQCHGLREPGEMEDVSLEEWQRGVRFAVERARARGQRVSIGGLSTGGTLALLESLRSEGRVEGGVYLFAGAFELYRRLDRSTLARLRRTLATLWRSLGKEPEQALGPLIGPNPFRYERIPISGVRQLLRAMREVRERVAALGDEPLPAPFFAAHSELDTSADIRGVERLFERADPERREFFRLGSEEGVPHASIVLEHDVSASDGCVLETRNPRFDEMMDAALAFAERVG